jgi:hypothetical protein
MGGSLTSVQARDLYRGRCNQGFDLDSVSTNPRVELVPTERLVSVVTRTSSVTKNVLEKEAQTYRDASIKLTGLLMAQNSPFEHDISKMRSYCKDLHKDAFNTSPGDYCSIRLQEIDIELLQRVAQLEEWKSSNQPSLLLLLGDNYEVHDENRGLLWLSPAALAIAEMIGNDYVLAFFTPCCQQRGGYQTELISLDRLLSSVIHQLLHHSEQFFIRNRQYVYEELKKPHSSLANRKAILTTILRSFGPKSDTIVYLVLDRLDLVDGEEFRHLVDYFINIMAYEKVTCIVKVAIMATNGEFQDYKDINE